LRVDARLDVTARRVSVSSPVSHNSYKVNNKKAHI